MSFLLKDDLHYHAVLPALSYDIILGVLGRIWGIPGNLLAVFF